MPDQDCDAEKRLVLKAIAGDEKSFRALVLGHQGRLRALIRRSLGDPGLADDIAQDVFIKAWTRLAQLREPEAFKGWLRQIASRAIVDHIRSSHLKPETFSEELAAESRSEHPVSDLKLDLQGALERLSPPQRLCILLAYAEGLTHGEIATETGLPIGTVKSHIARATPVLRQWLSPKVTR